MSVRGGLGESEPHSHDIQPQGFSCLGFCLPSFASAEKVMLGLVSELHNFPALVRNSVYPSLLKPTVEYVIAKHRSLAVARGEGLTCPAPTRSQRKHVRSTDSSCT